MKAAPIANAKMIEQLELLVNEIVKTTPHENRIRFFMESVGLVYEPDPIARMNRVLAALDQVRSDRQHRNEEHEI